MKGVIDSPRALTASTICALFCCFLAVHGQQASLRGPTGSVSEGAGLVTVCVDVDNANSIPSGGANIEVFISESAGLNPATRDVDYRLNNDLLSFLPGTGSRCTSITIIQDDIIEGSTPESIIVRIRNTDGRIQISTPDLITIFIQDDDKLDVGFTRSAYFIQENVGALELCTQITQLARTQLAPELDPITLNIVINGGTALNSIDYNVNLQEMYQFGNTRPRMDCIRFTIVDDRLIESNETIVVLLRDSNTNAVNIITPNTTVTIVDNDYATVALERSELVVIEGNNTQNSTLEVCVILVDISEGLRREIAVNGLYMNNTATAPMDFFLLNNSVTFQDNSRQGDRQCFQVLVKGDNFIEINEVFSVKISPLYRDLLREPSCTTVTIVHDGDGLCATLPTPVNGNVVTNGSVPGSIAQYSCSSAYTLVGPEQRECRADIGWSEEDPLCLRSCAPLRAIDNGNVSIDVGLPVHGAIATYDCNLGYRLNTGLVRICQGNGIWNGTQPVCLVVDCGVLIAPTNGRVSLASTMAGSMATFSCNAGFQLQGSRQTVCGEEGVWEGVAPICSGSDRISHVGGIFLYMLAIITTLSAHLLA